MLVSLNAAAKKLWGGSSATNSTASVPPPGAIGTAPLAALIAKDGTTKSVVFPEVAATTGSSTVTMEHATRFIDRVGSRYLLTAHKANPNDSAVICPEGVAELLNVLMFGMSDEADIKRTLVLAGICRENEALKSEELISRVVELARQMSAIRGKITVVSDKKEKDGGHTVDEKTGDKDPTIISAVAMGANADAKREFKVNVERLFDGKVFKTDGDTSPIGHWIDSKIPDKELRGRITAMFNVEAFKNNNVLMHMLYMHLFLNDQSCFDKEMTSPDLFACASGEAKMVTVMKQERKLPIYQCDDFWLVRLDYTSTKNSDLKIALYCMIPCRKGMTEALLTKLPSIRENLTALRFVERKVIFEFPMVDTNQSIDVLESLRQQGYPVDAILGNIGPATCLKKMEQVVAWKQDETTSKVVGTTIALLGTGSASIEEVAPLPLLLSAMVPSILFIDAQFSSGGQPHNLPLLVANLSDHTFLKKGETAADRSTLLSSNLIQTDKDLIELRKYVLMRPIDDVLLKGIEQIKTKVEPSKPASADVTFRIVNTTLNQTFTVKANRQPLLNGFPIYKRDGEQCVYSPKDHDIMLKDDIHGLEMYKGCVTIYSRDKKGEYQTWFVDPKTNLVKFDVSTAS